jgi:hypothetical protein
MPAPITTADLVEGTPELMSFGVDDWGTAKKLSPDAAHGIIFVLKRWSHWFVVVEANRDVSSPATRRNSSK